ncbi:hypothetical protein K474DRAFT_1703820, partial [Panus rudis PR-1116 ss-1]
MKTALKPDDLSKGGQGTPIHKVAVPERHVEQSAQYPSHPSMKHFLIGRQLSSSDAEPFGRETKGFIAFDTEKKDFVFLKDAWRSIVTTGENGTRGNCTTLPVGLPVPFLQAS